MNKVVVADLTPTSLETIAAFGINGGVHRFTLDELQNATIANGQNNTALTGKGGRTIGQLKRNKSVTVSGTNGMVSMGMIEVEVGSEGEHRESTPVRHPGDYLTVTDNKATTSFKAVGTAGNEVKEVIVKNSDGTINRRLTQDATATDGKFAYDPATKELTFADGELPDGTSILVHYDYNVVGDVISNISDNFSEIVDMYVDGLAEDKCHNIYHIQFHIPYADFTGSFDLAFGDSQTTHGFEATSLPQTCGNGGTKFWDLTVFGVNDVAEDAGAVENP